MPSIVINEMRGLNTSRARLQLKPGEAGTLQNVRQRPFDNWAKRKGVETALVQDDPVNGIFEWDMDEIVMGMYEAGGTLTFYPEIPITATTVGGTVTTITPSPEPVYDPLDPTGTGTAGGISFGIEQAMRALQERVVRRGGSAYTWPDGQRDAAGNTVTTPVATQPLSNYYGSATTATQFPQNGLYRYDCHYISNYAVTLVQSVIDRLDAECTVWLATDPEGQASLTTYTSSTFWNGVKPTATPANYKSILAEFWVYLPKLKAFSVTGTQVGRGGGTLDFGSSAGGPNSTSGPGACATSVSATQTEYQNYGTVWGAAGPITVYGFSKRYLNGVAESQALRIRGYATADLSAFKSGSAGIYLLLGIPGHGGNVLTAGQSPVVTADSKFHLYESSALGSTYTSSLLGDGGVPTIVADCNISAPFGTGWYVQYVIAAVVPRFTY